MGCINVSKCLFRGTVLNASPSVTIEVDNAARGTPTSHETFQHWTAHASERECVCERCCDCHRIPVEDARKKSPAARESTCALEIDVDAAGDDAFVV
jgi:hypothetical protein